MKTKLLPLVLTLLGAAVAGAAPARIVVPLDGTWQIEDSLGADDVPATFTHTAPVPGLAHLAQPAFPDVDKFDTKLVVSKLIKLGKLPESARITTFGVPRQNRNYFWYSRTFRAPTRKQVALLRINKAQFGSAVWLNGKKVGEHSGCFTAGVFDVTDAIDWAGDNRLTVRIGAHPMAMPADTPPGTDSEKTLWTPGIYDSVSVILSDNPVIESVQVAPRIANREAVVQTTLRNYGRSPTTGTLSPRVVEWKSARNAGEASAQPFSVPAGGTQTITQSVSLPDARLWSPDDPFLYTATVTSGGDEATVRFGMREFRADTATRRFYLNGRPIFLRGSNITLHRFFEDAQCGALPWDEKWLHKLLVEIPRRMSWNSFRFCIGPVPDRWLEIADENGLLIQQEYFIWTGAKENFPKTWTQESLTRELSEFVRDSWNHPSVAIWDACNETVAPVLTDVIRAVRKLDLSNRPWDNGYNAPDDENDPVESHPYEGWRGGTEILQQELKRAAHVGNLLGPTKHAVLINEYGWLWLNRDGTPTLLTENLYGSVLGKDATPDQRFEFNGYYLGAVTEYWRAYRNMAGVLHFTYLTSSYPGAFTADHWRDLVKLELEPHFQNYMSEAFKPLGVYISLWRTKLAMGGREKLPVMLVNDLDRPVRGEVALVLTGANGRELSRVKAPFALDALGQQTVTIDVALPGDAGRYWIKAIATADPALPQAPTVSRRRVELVPASEVPPIPPIAPRKAATTN